MKFFISFLLLLTSLLAGEIIFRSNAHIIKDKAEEVEEQSLETPLQPNIEETVKKKRVLRKIERVIEPQLETQERKIEDVSLENSESIYYINRSGEIFIHPKSVLDLRKILNLSQNEPLYYGLEGKLDTAYIYPFRIPPEGSVVYYGRELEQTPSTIEVRVDSKSPEFIGFEFLGESFKRKDGQVYYGGNNLQLKVSAVDSESGIKAIRVFNENDELLFSNQALFEQEKKWETIFEISSQNFKELIFEIEDNVTNVFRSEKIPVLVDLTPPKIQIQIEPELALDLENETCALGSKVSIIAKDEHTQVKEIQFRYPNSDWKKYISRLILNKPGIYRMEFRAIDYFGNTSLPEYFECKVLEP